ncbi:hypothetical protein ABT373_29040 [Streptomyces sp. NPDC000070]|uniref:hypothetical protein n=1 Tax=Streptomyces sp. NPDC000070 TaxID=3154240 RepID=UPI003332FBCD
MNASEPVRSAESHLRAVPPHALEATARRLLADRFAAQEMVLLLADYGLTVLQPVTHLPHTDDPVPANDGPAGRAFVTQTPVIEPTEHAAATHLVHLPITVRGDRLGILSVRLPGSATDPARCSNSPSSPPRWATRSPPPAATPTCTCRPAAPVASP